MAKITREGHPDWVPYRYDDGTYCVHAKLTSDPLHHKSNTDHIDSLDGVVAKLRVGEYRLRMSSLSTIKKQPSLISPKLIFIDGINFIGRV